MAVLEALSQADSHSHRRCLRDGTPIGGWLLKAAPGVWDLEAALASGDVPTSWRLAPTYRVELIEAGDPVVLWRTRGWAGPCGVVAVGHVLERPDPADEVPGDVDDPLWVRTSARDRPRPRLEVSLHVLDAPVAVEHTDAVAELRNLEVRRVPRIGNPSAMTPTQWDALKRIFENP